MLVDEQAPVVVREEIDVAAAPARVWEILTAIDRWPTWNPAVKEARLAGELAPGSVFRWKAGPGTITSTITALEPGSLIAWKGRTLGIEALHVYRIEAVGERALVRTEESWSGLIPRLLPGRSRRMLAEGIRSGLEHLKRESER